MFTVKSNLLHYHNRGSDILIPSACFLALVLAYSHYVNKYSYWRRRNVNGVKPLVPVLPELWDLLTKNRMRLLLERSKQLGKIYGSFFLGKPILIIADAEVLRRITIKDFDSFQDHQTNEWTNKYQRNSLIWLKGEHWRRVRALMTPTFTSGKIKRMFRLLSECAQDLVENFHEQLDMIDDLQQSDAKIEVDLYETVGMYTMDGITSCCYGIKLKREQSIEKASSRNAFVRDASQMFSFNFGRFTLLSLLPEFIQKYFQVHLLPESKLKPLADRVGVLVAKRSETPNKYDDLLQLLIDARLDDEMHLDDMDLRENHHAGLTHESLLSDQAKLKSNLKSSSNQQERPDSSRMHKVSLDQFEVLAESMFLLAAGLDTTRSSLSTITYLLAHNQSVQERLYKELKSIARIEYETGSQNGGRRIYQFDYDSLTSCEYLDAVISESLRFFSPVPMIDRVANEDYHIERYNINIPKGSRILLGLHSVHNDPDYWDKPEEFNPERFMPGQRERIVPGSYVPFGMGPRHCVGMRFSLTETKLGLAKTLMEFKFEPAPKTNYPPSPNFGAGIAHIARCRAMLSRRPYE